MRACCRIAGLLLATLAWAVAAWSAEAGPAQGKKESIFIGRIHVQPSVLDQAKLAGRDMELQQLCESLDSQLIGALSATQAFQIVERKGKADLELEQAYAQGGGVDPDDAEAAKVGKMAAAKYAFLPQIDGFEYHRDVERFERIERAAVTHKIFMSAVVKIVDTTSGKYLPEAASVQLNKVDTSEVVKKVSSVGSDQLLVALAKECAQRLCQDVVSRLLPAKVVDVIGKQVTINRGIDAGFDKDGVVEFYATREVKDVDTGESFQSEVPVGQGKIVRADGKHSYATISGEDLGIAPGCRVRIVSAPPVPNSASGAEDVPPGSSEKPLKWN